MSFDNPFDDLERAEEAARADEADSAAPRPRASHVR